MSRASELFHPTHEVTNQPPPLEGYNAYEQDRALVEALHREGAQWAEGRARALGSLVGSERLQQLARQANRFAPELRTHDRFGNRIDSHRIPSRVSRAHEVGLRR